MSKKKGGSGIYRPSTQQEFRELSNRLLGDRYFPIDALRPGTVRSLLLGNVDAASKEASDMAVSIGKGAWNSGPTSRLAWCFDSQEQAPTAAFDQEGKSLGLGFIPWGPGNAIPSTIPPLAQSSPYTAAPLRYIADLTSGLGVSLMYRFGADDMCDYADAGARLIAEVERLGGSVDESRRVDKAKPTGSIDSIGSTGSTDSTEKIGSIDSTEKTLSIEKASPENPALLRALKAYDEWNRSWLGYDVETTDESGIKQTRTVVGIKQFVEENNLSLLLSQCMQDDVMLDIYFPTIGFSDMGRRGYWNPSISRVSFLVANSTRLEAMNATRHINHVYYSDQWRTNGRTSAGSISPESLRVQMFPACMPQNRLADLRYIISNNQKTRAKSRPMWVCCPTFYPSLNKPYYPQPAWWSVFTSKAFDFANTVLFDKYKQRENRTSWGRIIYISLDYLDMEFSKSAYQGDVEKQAQFIDDLEERMENFLQQRDNQGKFMRQWMWTGPDGKEHESVKIVDIADTKKDTVSASKEELEMSTSPIFLALGVDPRLVGVPMVQASNGGTALREMHLLKSSQLEVKRSLFSEFINTICRFNHWTNAECKIKLQTLTTLDNSKTGTVSTLSGEDN